MRLVAGPRLHYKMSTLFYFRYQYEAFKVVGQTHQIVRYVGRIDRFYHFLDVGCDLRHGFM
jgi:hypothetical protein